MYNFLTSVTCNAIVLKQMETYPRAVLHTAVRTTPWKELSMSGVVLRQPLPVFLP